MSIFQLQAKDALARLGHYDALNCIQNLSWDAALNAENLQQLGDANYDAQTIMPEVTASFEARSTGALSSFLSRMIYTLNSGTGEYEGYLAGANMTGLNTQLIRETDLQFAVQDLIEAKKANEVFDRSTVIPRAHLSSFSLTANVDGTASENYQFEADLLEVYRTPLHDLISLPVVRTTASPTDTVELIGTAYEVEAGVLIPAADWKIAALFIDNVKVDVSMLEVTSGTGTGGADEINLSAAAVTAGYTIPLGARLALLVYAKTPGAFPTITYPTTARFVKADQIDIWLIDPVTTYNVGSVRTVEGHLDAAVNFNTIPFADSDLWLRVQNVDMSVNLNREALKELRKNDRGNSVYFRSATYPLNVTASLSALETDLNDWAKIQGKDLLGADATPDILDLADFENKEWMIIVRYYRQGTALQTVGILNAKVDGRGQNVAVQGRSEVSWNFTGSKIAIQGAA